MNTTNLHRVIAEIVAKMGREEIFNVSDVAATAQVKEFGASKSEVARVLDDFAFTGMLWQCNDEFQKRRNPIVL